MLGTERSLRGGIRQLRAYTHQIASDRSRYGACGLDGDVHPASMQAAGQVCDARRNHRLAAGQDGMLRSWKFFEARDDLVDAQFGAFRITGRIRRIAPRAAQIASAGAHEDRWHADEASFALQGVENFGYAH